MGYRPESARIGLEQCRMQAKELLRSFEAGDRATLERIRWSHPRFRGQADGRIREQRFVLADAQLVIARFHHFDGWPKLLRYIEAVERGDPDVRRFEEAADAVGAGDAAKLRALLEEYPDLVHERSPRGHRSTLLHYVSANGVEDYRQVTPPNVLDIARILLDAGADVHATSEAYGGDSTTLALVATSAHPRMAGVQVPLMDLLIERGAPLESGPPGSSLVRYALANGCPEAARALVERGAQVRDVISAAGLGRLDLVRRLEGEASGEDLERALVLAAGYGALDVVEHLLDGGVDIAAAPGGQTALHRATGGSDVATIELLVSRGAPLEKRNMYGGTALGQAVWFASRADQKDLEARMAVIDALVDAGADRSAYAGIDERLEELRKRAGAP